MIAVSTIPPSNGAWNMFDILATKKAVFTKARDVAICFVLTPARRIEEARVSKKCIVPVRIQTNTNAFI